jgi:redox-sensitive bicupin YhaK (pirin superfamily)
MNSIKNIIAADWVEMGGIPLRQPLPNGLINNIGPLLLIHHHKSTIPADSKTGDFGVGPHPHTGFAPVTFIFEGNVNHRDSSGHNSIVEAGGVQWMNAGKGIIHSERPSAEFAAKGGVQEIIQIWINSPAKFKQEQPKYFALNKNEIPIIEEQNLTIKVVAGNYNQIKGFSETQSPMTILEVHSIGKASHTFQFTKGYEHAIYNLDEAIDAEGNLVNGSHLVIINNETTELIVNFDKPTRLLVFDMEAINEPIATYGPFVMNTQSEIMQAIRDYQMGKMGVLIEEF